MGAEEKGRGTLQNLDTGGKTQRTSSVPDNYEAADKLRGIERPRAIRKKKKKGRRKRGATGDKEPKTQTGLVPPKTSLKEKGGALLKTKRKKEKREKEILARQGTTMGETGAVLGNSILKGGEDQLAQSQGNAL